MQIPVDIDAYNKCHILLSFLCRPKKRSKRKAPAPAFFLKIRLAR